MKLTLKITVEGGDDAVAQLNDFVNTAKSFDPIGYRTVSDGADGVKIEWVKDKTGDFTLLAFNRPSPVEQADTILACMISDDMKNNAINNYPHDVKPTCKTTAELRKKYSHSSWEGMLSKYIGLMRDFFDADLTVLSENAVQYKMYTYNNDFLAPFIGLSKRYPMLTFSFRFTRTKWSPGDRDERHFQREHEIWNGKCVHKAEYEKPSKSPFIQNRSWREGTPRRNIWNVVRSQIDENGNLCQQPNEFPNGRTDTGEESRRPERSISRSGVPFSEILRVMERRYLGDRLEEEPGLQDL